MRKRRLQFASMYLGLAACVGNSATLTWGFVQCEEPGGTFAIELVGDHSQCRGPSTPTHGHEEADRPPTECDVCCSCPCIDTPIGVALAVPGKRIVAIQLSVVTGRCLPPSTSAGAIESSQRRPPTVDGQAAHYPDPVTQRCLRSIVLLV